MQFNLRPGENVFPKKKMEWQQSEEADRDVRRAKRRRLAQELPTTVHTLHSTPIRNFDFGKEWPLVLHHLEQISNLPDLLLPWVKTHVIHEWPPCAILSETTWAAFLADILNYFVDDPLRFDVLLATEEEGDRQFLKEVWSEMQQFGNARFLTDQMITLWKYARSKLRYDWPRCQDRLAFYAVSESPEWNLTFGKWLATLLFPEAIWQVRQSSKWSTLYCSSMHMVFDIGKWAQDNRLLEYSKGLPYSCPDATLGGEDAFQASDPAHIGFTWSTLIADAKEVVFDFLTVWDCQQLAHTSATQLGEMQNYMRRLSALTLPFTDPRTFRFLSPSCSQLQTLRFPHEITPLPVLNKRIQTLLRNNRHCLQSLYAPFMQFDQLGSCLLDMLTLRSIEILACDGCPISAVLPLLCTERLIVREPYRHVKDLCCFQNLHILSIHIPCHYWNACQKSLSLIPRLHILSLNLVHDTVDEIEEMSFTWHHPTLRALELWLPYSARADSLPDLDMPKLEHLETQNPLPMAALVSQVPALQTSLVKHRLFRVDTVRHRYIATSWKSCVSSRMSLARHGCRHVSAVPSRHFSLKETLIPSAVIVQFHGPELPYWSDDDNTDSASSTDEDEY